jgi:hypothetical protein
MDAAYHFPVSETHDTINRILESESRQAEETKRFNAERAILLGLAPEKWREIKETLAAECEGITRASHSFAFKCDDSSRDTLEISRLQQGVWLPVAKFVYCEEIPSVFFEYDCLGDSVRGNLRFILCGATVGLANGNKGVILPNFIKKFLLDLTR